MHSEMFENVHHNESNHMDSSEALHDEVSQLLDRPQTNDASNMRDLLQNNERLVQQYTEKLVQHFSSVLFTLPEELQKEFIGSTAMFNDQNDVVYQGLRSAYENRAAS